MKKMEKYVQRAPKIIKMVIPGFTFVLLCLKYVDVGGHPIREYLYRDFPEIFQFAILFLMIAYWTSLTTLYLRDDMSNLARACRWCCIVFFASALSLFFACAVFSTDIQLLLGVRTLSRGLLRV